MPQFNSPPRDRSASAERERAIPQPKAVRYFQSNGELDPNLLDAAAEDCAKKLKEVAPTQLRRFYEHVLTLDRRLKLESERADPQERERAFERLRADFKMLKAKAVYANGRDSRQFPEEFLRFFIDHTAAVETARDFEAFVKHFQAVVAFHKFYGKEKTN